MTAFLLSAPPVCLWLHLSLLFVSALLGVLLPSIIRHKFAAAPSAVNTLFKHGNSFAAGILLAASLVHLLPQASDILGQAFPSLNFPLAPTLAVAGAVFIFVTDHVIRHRLKTPNDSWKAILADQHGPEAAYIPQVNLIYSRDCGHKAHHHYLKNGQRKALLSVNTINEASSLVPNDVSTQFDNSHRRSSESTSHSVLAYLLLVLLSFHSLLEGLALGSSLSAKKKASTLLLAILSHKLLAAFALGVSLDSQQHQQQNQSKKSTSYNATGATNATNTTNATTTMHTAPTSSRVLLIAIGFAAVSPLGVILGYLLTSQAHNKLMNSAICGSLIAISAGIFLYLSFELLIEAFKCNTNHNLELVRNLEGDEYEVNLKEMDGQNLFEFLSGRLQGWSEGLLKAGTFVAGAALMIVLAIWV